MITVTGDPLVVLILGIIFLLVGLLFVLKPNLVLKWMTWQQEKILGAKFIPSKRTSVVSTFTGAVFVIVGLLCLLLFFFGDFQ
jgi:hypothetical protein